MCGIAQCNKDDSKVDKYKLEQLVQAKCLLFYVYALTIGVHAPPPPSPLAMQLRRLQQMTTTISMVPTLEVVKWERNLRPTMISLESRIWLKRSESVRKWLDFGRA